MEQDPKSRGGRPWSFNRDAAVATAMRLFWRHGYEGVSISDLTKAIGIAPPSLYAAFGSKEGLYREALDRYQADFGSFDVASLRSAPSLAAAVRALLDGAVKAVTDPAREPGCMISSGMIACHPDHWPLARDAAARREALRERIARELEPLAGPDTAGHLARHLSAVMQGLSIQARDGASATDLQEIVDEVVAGIAARQR